MTEQTAFGLVFDVLSKATADERAQGRLITLHSTSEAATQYFNRTWPEYRKTYGDPTLPSQNGRVLALSVINEQSCYGTAYDLGDVHRLIGNAQAEGMPCYAIRHDSMALRPELFGNEANKLIAQSDLIFVPTLPSSPRHHRLPRREPR